MSENPNILSGKGDPSLYEVSFIDEQIIVARLPNTEQGEIHATPIAGFSLRSISIHGMHDEDRTVVRLTTGETLLVPIKYPEFISLLAEMEEFLNPSQEYSIEEGDEINFETVNEEDLTDLERSEFLKKNGKLN